MIDYIQSFHNQNEVFMKKQDVEQRAFSYYDSGYHCAEAVLKTVADLYNSGKETQITRYATGFGGGIGGSCTETCGALTGGIIAIGWLFGRDKTSDDKQKAFLLSAEFRESFIRKFGNSN